MFYAVVFVILSSISYGLGTKVNQCPGGNIDSLQELVTIGECVDPPCKLKRNTKVPLRVKFVAEEEYKDLVLSVTGDIAGVVLPFLGVDGKNPCDHMFEEDGTTRNNCKFVKGKTYLFHMDVDILQIYPRVKVVVHFAITDTPSGQTVTCFEVPAAISN